MVSARGLVRSPVPRFQAQDSKSFGHSNEFRLSGPDAERKVL